MATKLDTHTRSNQARVTPLIVGKIYEQDQSLYVAQLSIPCTEKRATIATVENNLESSDISRMPRRVYECRKHTTRVAPWTFKIGSTRISFKSSSLRHFILIPCAYRSSTSQPTMSSITRLSANEGRTVCYVTDIHPCRQPRQNPRAPFLGCRDR